MALARLEVEVAGGHVGTSDPTVAELLTRWMDHLARLGRSDSTLYGYRRYVNRELVPAIGDVRLSKLTARHLDGLYTALTNRGLAPATVRQIHALVRAALNQAVRWGLVGRNVGAAGVGTLPAPARATSADGGAGPRPHRGGDASSSRCSGCTCACVAATGMRRSEACGLRWSDVEPSTGRLTVSRSHVSLPGAVGDRPTKTRSARTVTLDEGTADALRAGWRAARQLARFAGVDDDTRRAGYVFSFDADGAGAWRGDTVSARWERARRAAGITGVRLHDLRHWQATQLLDAGVPVPTVAARLGHADGTTTMKIYAHRTERADEQAAARRRRRPRSVVTTAVS